MPRGKFELRKYEQAYSAQVSLSVSPIEISNNPQTEVKLNQRSGHFYTFCGGQPYQMVHMRVKLSLDVTWTWQVDSRHQTF